MASTLKSLLKKVKISTTSKVFQEVKAKTPSVIDGWKSRLVRNRRSNKREKRRRFKSIVRR